MRHRPRPVESIESQDGDCIRHRMRSNRSPIIVRSAMGCWPALSRWDVEYLEEKIGAGQKVAVSVSPDGVFHIDPARGFRLARMTFGHYLEHISRLDSPAEHYYLMQAPIPEKFPALQADFNTPEFIGKKQPCSINLWLGKPGTVAPLHYDAADNFLTQIQGLKRVVLYSLDDLPKFCPNPLFADVVKYPAFAMARPFECTLRKGEMLFIPAGWWHQVQTLELSVSVNFWWLPWSFYASRSAWHMAPLALLSGYHYLRKMPTRLACSRTGP